MTTSVTIFSKKIIFAFLLLSGFLLITSFHTSVGSNLISNGNIKVIVLDAGHGGKDPGAVGKKSKEKNINLAIVLKLGALINKELPDVKVIYTRKTDVFLPLHTRPALANKNKADLFISVHCNSASGKASSPKGTETYLLGYGSGADLEAAIRENASILMEDNYKDNYDGFDPKDPSSYIVYKVLKRQYRSQSIKLASAMQKEFATSSRQNRGVKEAPYAVLRSAAMPAVLTEIGFISNSNEENYMISSSGQAEIVRNLFNAIKKIKTSS